jgi:hypothetical protein
MFTSFGASTNLAAPLVPTFFACIISVRLKSILLLTSVSDCLERLLTHATLVPARRQNGVCVPHNCGLASPTVARHSTSFEKATFYSVALIGRLAAVPATDSSAVVLA